MDAPLFIIIPAYNAARALPDVLSDLKRELSKRKGPLPEVVVVDDGSTDGTSERARELGAQVLRHPQNRGKGAALRTGLSHAQTSGARSAVTMDADGQHRAKDALALLDHPAPPDTFVIGVRDLKAARAPRANRASNAFSNLVISAFAGTKLLDTQCGLRRYPLPLTFEFDSGAPGFAFEADVLLRAARAGARIEHTPVSVHYPEDRTTHFDSVRDPAKIVYFVLRATAQVRRQARTRSFFAKALLPPFFVTVTAPEPNPAALDALLDACTAALAQKTCVEASPADTPDANVEWDEEQISASIQLTRSGQTLRRTVSFQASDPELERYRAVGFALGTWAQEDLAPAPRPPEEASPPRLAPETPVPTTRSSPTPPRKRRRPARPREIYLEAHALAGTGSAESARFGGGVGFSVLRAAGPVDLWFLTSGSLSTPLTRNGVELEVAYWSLGSGIGTTAQSDTAAISVAAGPFVEAAFTSGPALTSGSRVGLGVEGFVWLRLRLHQRLQLLLGGEGGVRFGSTFVIIDDQVFETIPPGFVSGRAGLALSL